MWRKLKFQVQSLLRVLYYNAAALLYVAWRVVKDRSFRALTPKERPDKPAVLSDGVKDGFAEINVSDKIKVAAEPIRIDKDWFLPPAGSASALCGEGRSQESADALRPRVPRVLVQLPLPVE